MATLKPLHKSVSVPLLQLIRGLSLTKLADEALLSDAAVVSEGKVSEFENGRRVYLGSTLVTVGLERRQRPEDDSKLMHALQNSILFRLRLMRLARAEAERKCSPDLPVEMFIQTEFRIEESALFVDITVECPLEVRPGAADRLGGSGS